MRILLISDVHANRWALEAIAEPHDVCISLGDWVDYGVEPGPCIAWARHAVQFGVRGNHDHGVAQNVIVQGPAGFKYLTGASRPLTRAQLAEDDRRYLASLPVTRVLTLAGQRFFLVHATPRDPFDEYALPELGPWTRRLEPIDADFVCVGHTHQPYVLEVGRKRVVNPGSVGLPRDGDPRASYAVIEDGRVELKRVEYPVEEAVRALESSQLPEEAKWQLTEVYRTGRLGKGNGFATEAALSGN